MQQATLLSNSFYSLLNLTAPYCSIYYVNVTLSRLVYSLKSHGLTVRTGNQLNSWFERMENLRPHLFLYISVTDPGFPRWGDQPQGGCHLLFGQLFYENCMKMKKMGLKGGVHPPMHLSCFQPARTFKTDKMMIKEQNSR